MNAATSAASTDSVMEPIYARGDRIVGRFVWLHALIALALAPVYGTWLVTGAVTACAVALFFIGRLLLPGSFVTRCLAGVSLQVFVALHIYQLHGLAEMHFFFFTAFTILIVYQDWRCMWPGAFGIIAQHITFALLHNTGARLYFFEESYVGIFKLFFHFGIALSHVALCGYWALLLRRQTLSSATQHADLQEKNDELRAAKEEAERANAAKSEFLSRMSHELRTPLNAILGFGQLLQMDDPSPGQKQSIDHILKGGRHLLGLIDEVLDLARIESGQLALALESVDAAKALTEAVALVQPLADRRGVRLGAPDFLPGHRTVQADPRRLNQVLLNLLSNAVKYNRDGGAVHLRCHPLPGDPAGSLLRISVADTGPGIPADGLSRLFAPFERLGAEQRGQIEGTGIGLAISKRLVEAMGGQLGVESVPGQGSTFTVDLAAAPALPDPVRRSAPSVDGAAAATTSAHPQRTVLYVDDNLDNLFLIERLLQRRAGLRMLAAAQGRLGLEMAREHQPDLILLDLHLPDMHGEAVLEELRADPHTAAIPVLIVSADATARQIERLRDRGARDYLTKPLDVPHFLRTVEETLASTAVPTPTVTDTGVAAMV